MGLVKKWAEINATHLGLCILQVFLNLERGEDGEVEVELRLGNNATPDGLAESARDPGGPRAGRWLKIVPDLHGQRIVIFEIQKSQERFRVGPENAPEGGKHA